MTSTGVDLVDRTGHPVPFEEVADLWPLGGWLGITPVPGGKNDHYRLSAGEGEFFLRLSHRTKSRAELVAQLGLMRLVAERGLPVPVPVATRSGDDHALVGGRLWTVTRAIDGKPYDDASPVHLHRLGATIGRYHALTDDLDGGSGPPLVLEELRARAAAPGLPATLKGAVDRVAERLAAVSPSLPRAVVHGGARRGSLLFQGDRVVGLLDFDSAHADVRLMDLAVAAHDVGKVYTQPADPDNKLRVDLGRVEALLAGYATEAPLTATERAALPILLEAKRLKRLLGRVQRRQSGEVLSDNDHAKITLEERRLAWLQDHRSELDRACAPRSSG